MHKLQNLGFVHRDLKPEINIVLNDTRPIKVDLIDLIVPSLAPTSHALEQEAPLSMSQKVVGLRTEALSGTFTLWWPS